MIELCTFPLILFFIVIVLLIFSLQLKSFKDSVKREIEILRKDIIKIKEKIEKIYPELKEELKEPEAKIEIGKLGKEIIPADIRIQKKEEKKVFERLSANIFIWIGALSFVLASAFLIKYSIEKGLISPSVRVLMGIFFGLVLLLLGEFIQKRSRKVGDGISAGGIGVLYLSLYSTVSIYHLIPPALGFFLMAIVTAIAVLLSFFRSPVIAILGLLGGFLTPILIRFEEPRPENVFPFIIILQIALGMVALKRNWFYLLFLSLLGGFLWSFFWLILFFEKPHFLWVGFYAIISSAFFNLFFAKKELASKTQYVYLGKASVVSSFIILSMLTKISNFELKEWIFFSFVLTATLIISRLKIQYSNLAYISLAFVLFLLFLWKPVLQLDINRYLLTCLFYSSLFIFLPWIFMLIWKSEKEEQWALLSSISSILFFLLAYYKAYELKGFHWGIVTLILSFLFSFFTLISFKIFDKKVVSIFAISASLFLSLTVPLELKREWIAVAWAMEIPAIIFISDWLKIPKIKGFLIILTIFVMFRLLNPFVLEYPIGDMVIFNWITYGFGIPILSMALSAWKAYRMKDKSLSELWQGCTIFLFFVYITLQIRQAFHPGKVISRNFFIEEWGVISIFWLLLAISLILLHRKLGIRSLIISSKWIIIATIIQSLFCQIIFYNPMIYCSSVGSIPIINKLIILYLLPSFLFAIAGKEMERKGRKTLPYFCYSFSLLLLFLFVTLEVRQIYRGEFIYSGKATLAEKYTYSIAWILMGILLVIIGIIRRSDILRYSSLVVMVISIFKVFLYDSLALKDLYRILSFVGLGVSLFLLAYLYHNVVFKRENGDF